MYRVLGCFCILLLCTAVTTADLPTSFSKGVQQKDQTAATTATKGAVTPAAQAGPQSAGPAQFEAADRPQTPPAGARQGGEDCASAVVLSGPLPITATGTTIGFADDYDTVCEITSDPGAGDVVYSFTPPATDFYDISLCNDPTDYDTKLYVRTDCAGADVACNDDTCTTASFAQPFVSIIEGVSLDAGTEYFIIVDGWGLGDEGAYELTISVGVEPPPLPECPEDTMVGQRAWGEEEAWAVYVSNANFPNFTGDGRKLLENFAGVPNPITDVHWWGITAIFDDNGDLIECPLDPGEFTIEFYAHDPVTNRPNLDLLICSYTANAGNGLTKIANENLYGDFRLWYWSFDLPTPCSMFEGWIAIQNTDLCMFWWAGSPEGGTIHVATEDGVTQSDEDGDLAYCLTGDTTPLLGACCDTSLGLCRDTDSTDCVGAFDTWFPGTDCASIPCDAEIWACCISGPACIEVDLNTCNEAGGEFFSGFVCDEISCEAPPTPGITCAGDADYSQDLTGGSLWVAWDRDGDRRHPIDNYSGVADPITRVSFWGNTIEAAFAGPDCLPDSNPTPFVIKFYPDLAGAPDVDNPACEFVTDATFAETSFVWTGQPWGNIEFFEAILPGACSLSSGWISIAYASSDCDFIAAPATEDGTMFFFSNGDLTDESGDGQDRAFCLFTGDPTGACCDLATGTCTDGVPQSDCGGVGFVFYEDMICDDVPSCDPAPGACCDQETGDCEITLLADCSFDWLGVGSTCDDCCVIVCPEGGILEGEPVCFSGYVDTYNYGCFDDDPQPDDFLPIAVGDVYCGESGTYTTDDVDLRDFDFYIVELASPSLLTFNVVAEFQPDVFIFPDTSCELFVLSEGTGDFCEQAVASAALEAGSYHLAVSALGTVECGTPYNAWIEVSPAGTCEIEPDICVVRTENVCLALGGTWTEGASCGGPCLNLADSNCDGAVNAFDIDPFVVALADRTTWEATFSCDYLCANDINCDGMVNAFDIDPFVVCLASGGCGQCP